ncbi:hypothetical protein PZB75_20850 [Streptomyces sp. AM 4-1-1]|uniref:hypothetical protein n=1 Tax=Streptomyces sp. AM 4-1-1 TaxID=3028710 RepID=UPI0023B986C4|nr:hypothetical protein [Streptomyces sp. AM 4-1-1]WEH35586.1 hypothetical protein PZB75_20850 [Streptomyces sp. AM 4-1-1]
MRGNYVHLGVNGGTFAWTPSASGWKQLTLSFITGASRSTAEIHLHGRYSQGTYNAVDVSLDGPART